MKKIRKGIITILATLIVILNYNEITRSSYNNNNRPEYTIRNDPNYDTNLNTILNESPDYSEYLVENNSNSSSSTVEKPHYTSEIKEKDFGYEKVTYVRTVDGDTIIVKNSKSEDLRIRLLLVNTQESVSRDESRNNDYGRKASKYTKTLLENKDTLYLEYDEAQTDQYGRTLAYVWLENVPATEDNIKKYMLNGILIDQGVANVVYYRPNKKYKEILDGLEKSAKNENTGFWAEKEFRDLVER